MEDNKILKCISDGQPIKLAALDGSRLICEAEDVFRSIVNASFVGRLSSSTPEALINVYEVIEDANFMKIFQSLPGTWNQKYLTQSQVVEFCEKQALWLDNGGIISNLTFFLIKKDEDIFINEDKPWDNLAVVLADFLPNDLTNAYILRLNSSDIWETSDRHRVVVSQL